MSELVKELTLETFSSDVLNYDGLTLVDFWAPWCGPCRQLGPVIEKVAEEFVGKVNVYKLNTDDVPEIATRYGIRSIPSVLIFDNGVMAYQKIGVWPVSKYAEVLNSLMS